MHDQKKLNMVVLASYVLAAISLFVILHSGLLAALFSGMLVYSLVHMLTPVLGKNIEDHRARMLAVILLSSLIVALLAAGIWGAVSFFQSDAGSLERLFQKMADILEASRTQMPPWLQNHVPDSAEATREAVTSWLREHASQAQIVGQQAGRTVAHLLVGMVIGAMAALYDATTVRSDKPLSSALHRRVLTLQDIFRRIVFAQTRIAGLNALFTAIFLLVVLPLAGVHLPLTKTMIALTFFAGLLPVIGNLISNSVIVIVGLSHSLIVACASLLFLIVIHKLEYFLNAKIIGSHINARAWELLSAMLVMEALFGLPGVIAAPVFYAYLKKELSDRDLV